MADLTKTAANLRMLDSVECRLIPMIAGEAIDRGEVVYRKTDGKAGLAQGDAAGTATPIGIATSDAPAGGVFDALYWGRLVGYDLSGLNPGARVYISGATAGALATAAPTVAASPIGSVQVMTDIAGTKFLMVDISPADSSAGAGMIAVTDDLMAASVDEWMFVADRAYRVMGFREIHSVVGGSSAAVSPRKILAATVAAPGASVAAGITELTTAAIDLTAAVNVAQTPTLTATDADRLLAAGDKVGLDYSGTLTGLVGKLVMYLMPV